ncbi:MAG: hypothetical protein ACTSPG_07725 [Candidatus Hodarchaeales archaeon]
MKLHYEQQNALVEQIKVMRRELREEQKLATRFRKQRDRFKAERQALLEKASPDVESRDSQKSTLEKLKKRRDFLRRQSMRQDGPVFKVLSPEQLEKLTIVELRYHLYELEFKQQTSSLSKEDEEILIDEIEKIEERIALLEKQNEALVADYLGNIPENKEKLEQEISAIEQQISKEESERKELSQRIQKLYSKTKPLKEAEDQAHEEFVKHLQRVEELKVEIETKQEEVDALKGKIAKLKKMVAEEEYKKTYGKIEERIQDLLKKKESGESLTPEEQEFLMSYGYVPF